MKTLFGHRSLKNINYGKLRSSLFLLCAFVLQTTLYSATYYLKTSVNPSTVGVVGTLGNWTTSAGGTGSNPSNFTTSGDVWDLNLTSATTVQIGGWSMNGTLVNTGGFTATLSTTGTFTSTYTAAVWIVPTATLVASGINVTYGVLTGGQTIPALTYNNLTLSNTSLTNTAAGAITVNGTLTTTSGGTLAMLTNGLTLGSGSTLTNNGTISTTKTSAWVSDLRSSGAGTYGGTITFAATTGGQTIPAGTYVRLTLNNSIGTNTLDGNITVSSILALSSGGKLSLNGKVLTVDQFSGNGLITGSSASEILTAGTTASTLYLDNTTPGTTNALKKLTCNGSNTLTLGTSLSIVQELIVVSGKTLNMGVNTLTLGSGSTLTCSGIISTSNKTSAWVTDNRTGGGSGTTAGTYGGNIFFAAAAGGQTIPAGTYNHLTLNHITGTNTADGNITVNGAFNMGQTGAIFDLGTNVFTLGLSTSTLTFTGTLLTRKASGWIVDNRATRNYIYNGTFEFAGTSQTIPAEAYYRIKISGTASAGGNITVNTGGTLTITTGGTLDMGANTLTLGSGFASSLGNAVTVNNNGTITTGGSLVLASGITLVSSTIAGNGTVNYNASGNQTVLATTYYNLTLSGSGDKSITSGTAISAKMTITGSAKAAITAGLNIAVRSLFFGSTNQAAGTWGSTTATSATNQNNTYFTATTGYLTVTATYLITSKAAGGNWSSTATWNGGVVPLVTDDVRIDNSSSVTVDASAACANLTINDGSTLNIGAFAFTVAGTTTVGGGTSGILNITSATGTKTFTGLVTLNSGSTWGNTSANSPVTFSGGITNSGTFNAGTGIHNFNTNSQSLTGSLTIPKITIGAGSYNIVLTNNGTLTCNTSLIGGSAGYQGIVNNGTLNIGGTFDNTTYSNILYLTATAVGNTVAFNQLTGGIARIPAGTYNNLTFGNTSGTNTALGAITVNGTLTTTAGGTFNLGTNLLTLGSGSGTVTVNNNGTITTGGGTVLASGSTLASNKINGTGTVDYNASVSQTVLATNYGNLTLSGSGNKSISSGTAVSSKMTITGSAKADIGTGLNISVGSLLFGTTSQATGTWGYSGRTNNNTTYFTNTTGYLTVLTLSPMELASAKDLTSAGVAIYPNPAVGSFNVAVTESFGSALSIVVMNMNGATVKSISTLNHGLVNIDTHDLSEGIYVVRVQSEGGLATQKINITQ